MLHGCGPQPEASELFYSMWLLNLFTLGEFSLCNQYSLVLQCPAGTGNEQNEINCYSNSKYGHCCQYKECGVMFSFLLRQGSSKVSVCSEPVIWHGYCKHHYLLFCRSSFLLLFNKCLYILTSIVSAPSGRF